MSTCNVSEIWLDRESHHRTLTNSGGHKPKFKLCYKTKKLKEFTLISLFGNYFYHFLVLKGHMIPQSKGWFYSKSSDIENISINPGKDYGSIDFSYGDVFKLEVDSEINPKISANKFNYAYKLKQSKYNDLDNHILLNEEAGNCYYNFQHHEVSGLFCSIDHGFDIGDYT